MIKFSIPYPPVTKKNHQRIMRGKNGRPFVRQSEAYLAYEALAMASIPKSCRVGVDRPVNIKAVYYMPTRRKVDLCNLHAALHDVLVKAGVIADDNCNIVASTDGSRVCYDKACPRTEVEIEEAEG